jgi:DNA gyrase subunit A
MDKNTTNTNNFVTADIVAEMKQSYINYAMSVIVARALPDVRDGLKPVQRRILYAMYKLSLYPSKGYKKSARVVGDVIGKYHPHGDQAVYDTLVRMVQDFSLRYPLIDGQGNFGSIDGDGAAAMRYTEIKLHKIAMNIIDDIASDTVDFVPNYDGNYKEPAVMPTTLPQLLLNGGEGIAVGMATKIPPHNVTEVLKGVIESLKNGSAIISPELKTVNYPECIKTQADIKLLPKNRFPSFETSLTVDDLFEFIPGPDFPTGGVIYDAKELKNMYATGKGRVLMRGIAKIEESKSGKYEIIVSQLPYQVNKARLVARIAELANDKKLEGISDIRDESNKLGIRVVIELKRDAKPKVVLNNLFKFTELQKAFNTNLLCLVDNEPKVLSLKAIIEYFIKHRQEVSIRKFEYDLAKAQERIHILEGLMIALANLDDVIKIIRASKDSETAKNTLIEKYKLSEIQSIAILDMQLRRLAALERLQIENEYNELKKVVDNLISILSDQQKVIKIILENMEELLVKFNDARRTKIIKSQLTEINEEDLVPKEDVVVTLSEKGYIKRMLRTSYTVQNRGGKGKLGMEVREDDIISNVISCSTHDKILFFSNKGRVFETKVYEIPEFGRTAKGQALVNIINLDAGEKITSVLTHTEGKFLDSDIEEENENSSVAKDFKYFFMATKNGIVKKTLISEYANIRQNGLIAINLEKNDELVWVKPTTGKDTVLLVTNKAKSIHFNEKDVRETGRATMGVIGIKFAYADDFVIAMDVVRKTENVLFTITEKGFGKVTKLNEFTLQGRGGSGVFAHNISTKTGKVIAARVMDHPDLDLLILSKLGQSIRIAVKNLPERSRQTSGVHLMRLGDNSDMVSAIAFV